MSYYRPHPNECSGGDLDGDLYFVSWDENLVPPKTVEPMEYIARRPRIMDHDVRLEVTSAICITYQNDLIPKEVFLSFFADNCRKFRIFLWIIWLVILWVPSRLRIWCMLTRNKKKLLMKNAFS